MIQKKLLVAGLGLCLPMAASADFIGFRVGAYAWQQQFEGSVQDGPDSIDIEDTLGIDDETNTVLQLSFEHPVPIIPNIALSRTDLDVSARNTIDQSFTFDGETFFISDTITTNADLSHTDVTLYYEILDNWVSLDVGITARLFDEGVHIRSTTSDAKLDIDGGLPMLYAAVKFELPLSGLYIGADANGISYKDSSVIDYKVNIGYETSFGLGVELGMRSFEIDYEDEDDSSENADLTIDGTYVGVFYHF